MDFSFLYLEFTKEAMHVGAVNVFVYTFLLPAIYLCTLLLGLTLGWLWKIIDDGESRIFLSGPYNPILHLNMKLYGHKLAERNYANVYIKGSSTQDSAPFVFLTIALLASLPTVIIILGIIPILFILIPGTWAATLLLRSGRRTQKKITKHINNRDIHNE